MVFLQSYFPLYNYLQDKSTYYDCWITLQTSLKIAASNLYCKITLFWLDSSLSVGLERISGRLLKISATVIDKSIAFMLNLSLKTERFPTKWKTAKVIPIHKKRPTTNTKNYRPISTFPVLSKIMERYVCSYTF